MNETELYHHGILGQRWGVRRYQNADGSLTDAGKRRAQAKERRAVAKDRKQAAKNRSLLSDKELNERVQRLEREKRLNDLTNQEVRSGKNNANKTLSRYGNQVTGILVSAAAGMAVKAGKDFVQNGGLQRLAKYAGKSGFVDMV